MQSSYELHDVPDAGALLPAFLSTFVLLVFVELLYALTILYYRKERLAASRVGCKREERKHLQQPSR